MFKITNGLVKYVLFGVFFLAVSTLISIGFVSTSYVGMNEKIFFLATGRRMVCGLVVSVLFFLLLSKVGAVRRFVRLLENNDRFYRFFYLGSLICLVINLTIWIIYTDYKPFADSLYVHQYAEQYLAGDYTSFQPGNYMEMYSHQSRLMLVWASIDAVFGGFDNRLYCIINGISLVMLFVALTDILKTAGASRLSRAFTMFTGAFWLPGLFYTSFLYGNLLGLSLAMLAIALWVRFFSKPTGSRLWMGLAGGLLAAFAFMFKALFIIHFVAMMIYAILELLKTRRLKLLIPMVFAIMCLYTSVVYPQKVIEAKTGIKLDNGVPSVAFVAMGFQEGPYAPGWYNGWNYNKYYESKFNKAVESKVSVESIKKSIANFVENPKYAVIFFEKKVAAMWNEPTFESVFNLKGNDNAYGKIVKWLTSYDGYRTMVPIWKFFQIFVWVGSLIYVNRLLKEKNTVKLILPMIFVGGFVFHLFWEAKGQYAFLYFVCLIPVGIEGWAEYYLSSPGKVPAKEKEKHIVTFFRSRRNVVRTICFLLAGIVFTATFFKSAYKTEITKDNVDYQNYLYEVELMG